MPGQRFLSAIATVLLAWAGSPLFAEEPKESPMVKVAMCQIFALDGDRSGNFVRIENALREAAGMGAEIACFPEMCILGWVNPDAHQRSFPIPGEDTDRLGALARKYGLWMTVGLGEKDGDKLHNTVVLIDDEGRIVLKHHKMNTLDFLMDPPYTRGTEVRAVDTKFGRIGLLICADTFKGEILERMKALDPDLLLIPYGWAAKEDAWPDHGQNLVNVVANAAKSTGAAAVGVDLVGEISKGPWFGQTYGGFSVAVNRGGEVLAVAKDRDRDIVLVEIDLARPADAESGRTAP